MHDMKKVKEALKNGNVNRDNALSVLGNILNEQQTAAVKNILADKNKLDAILSSPFAKSFMEKMNGKKEE